MESAPWENVRKHGQGGEECHGTNSDGETTLYERMFLQTLEDC